MDENAMTVRDVASYLSVNEKTVYRLAQKGELPGFKVAGAWRFWKKDINCWIEDQKKAVSRQDADVKLRSGGGE
ncbi:MAG: helix-turn-helix domain-containing protein [Deltaproteobacteria bacterium]|nr:helix-turn-helix domain-containing protein [Deltaproteobacteria bacterium]